MNPYQMKKVDVSSMTPDEQRLFRLYGKLPSTSDHLSKHLKERKYFDSGDYALSKAGKASSVDTGSVGSEHPVPENIPHLSSPIMGSAHQGIPPINSNHYGTATSGIQNRSPVKESSFLNRETSLDEQSTKEDQERDKGATT
ncbi:putative camp-regulated phosphoprotein family protein [Erysiphe necator]|uniref:mRNA stability protein n=1 Tax=Uncinula necator TaxID=52586 RepID=A0A0B1NVJ5_UNCNE|nr:putative camp-regulated phosphoprotein family protein [Erysiphe necator]